MYRDSLGPELGHFWLPQCSGFMVVILQSKARKGTVHCYFAGSAYGRRPVAQRSHEPQNASRSRPQWDSGEPSEPCRSVLRGAQPARSSEAMRSMSGDRRTHSLPMRVIGLAGWSGSGKTTLLRRLIPVLTARGLRVSTLKHAHHSFDVDQPGKDSWEHRQAGAKEVLVASAVRWALMHELHDEAEPGLRALLGRMQPVDLVLVEGFKRERHPKIEVYRWANAKTLLHPGDPSIVAVAADVALEGPAIPLLLHLDDVEGIADVAQSRAMPIDGIHWSGGLDA
jgi:molybdopterin-guanine dinucleotide biosynthesis adapter protein